MPAFPCQTCQQINVAPLSDYEANEQTLPPVPLPFVETGTFVNEAVFFKLNCAEGEVPVFTGTLPPWITIDAANCQLVGAPGTFTGGGEGGVTAVNGVAQEFLDDFAVDSVISGELTPPPLPVFPDTTSNSETSIPLGTPAGQEAVFTGVLPGWITINNEDGTLEADPGFFTGTSGVNADIAAENALQEFLNDAITSGELTFQPIPPPPPPPPVGPDWTTLLWGVPDEGYFSGSGSFTPSSAAGASFNDSVACGEDGAANIENFATISVTAAANCRVSGLYVFSADTGGTTTAVEVWSDAYLTGTLLGSFYHTVNFGSDSNSFTFDFVAPVATIVVRVYIAITANGPASSSASNITGTVSNVP